MNLKYELRKIERANKANPQREQILLRICDRFIPDESKSALAYVRAVRWIDMVWREFAKENRLRVEAFKKWYRENYTENVSLLGW